MIHLKLSLSLQHYQTKESIDIKKLCFKRSSISIEDFVKHIKEGYCFCHWFNTKTDTFTIYEKTNANFDKANVLFVDVDDFSMEMKQFVGGLSMKPTVYYTTPNNLNPQKENKYRFRLCYVFNEDIPNGEMLASAYRGIIREIRKDYPTYPDQDSCGARPAQYMNGNGTPKCEAYSTECVYSLSNFGVSQIEPIHEETVTTKEKINGNEYVYSITDSDFINDLYTLPPSDLIAKYHERYYYFDHSELTFNDGYALVPEDYQEIYRSWYQDTFINNSGDIRKVSVIKIKRDGDNRRKCLFVSALIRRKIMPDITFEHLLYNLVAERQWYYDNSDNVLNNQELMRIANNALSMAYETINVSTKRKPSKFKVDKTYCLEKGIKPKAMVGLVRRKLKDEEIGSLYDCSLSVKENLEQLKANGIKIGLSRLYEFCDKNGIPRRSYRKMKD